MNGLPHGWATAKLGELVKFAYGKSLPGQSRSGSGYPVFGSNGIVGYHGEPLTRGETIVIGRKGSVGEINYSDTPCSPIDTTYYIDQFHGMPSRYWFYLLQTLNLSELNKSTAIPGLSREDAYQLEIALAPLPEQPRIADKLDALMSRVDVVSEGLDRVPALLRRFRQSVLAAATSGDLTEEWRNGKDEDDWKESTIGDICASSFYGPRFGKDEYTIAADGIPTIRTTDMTDDGKILVTEDTPRVLVPTERIERFRAKKGDLLVTRTGSIGVMAVFDGDYDAIPSAYLIRFRFKPEILSRYAFFCLMSPAGQSAMGLSATAITQPNINAESIKAIGIQLPSLKEQTEIIRRVEALFALADKVQTQYEAARTRVDKLTPALLAKAFRGELVPQDPSDEPAEKLLERLRAGKAGDTKQMKNGRKSPAAHQKGRKVS